MDQRQEKPAGQPTTLAPGPGFAPEPPKKRKTSTGSRWSPRPKVAAGVAVGTPLAIVLSWLATLAGLEMPEEVALALAGLIVGAVGYFTPE